MVLMSESIDGLQNMLNAMSLYLSRFLISCLDPLVLLSIPIEWYSRSVSCALNLISTWELTVNTKKTINLLCSVEMEQIEMIKKKWLYNNKALDIVDQFCYSVVLFHYNCKCLITQKRCPEQGMEAMFCVRKSTSSLYLYLILCLVYLIPMCAVF
jgi:hypothetical protein